MRDCEAYMEQISALLDGEIGEYETDVLMAHLDACPECRIYYDAFQSVSENVGLLAAAAPDGFAAEVMRAIESGAAPAAPPRRGRTLGRFAAIAACLAVILLAASRLELETRGGAPSLYGASTAAPVAPQASLIPEPSPETYTDANTGGNANAGWGATEPPAAGSGFASPSNDMVLMMGEGIRPIDAREAKEFTDSLADVQRAEFYIPSSSYSNTDRESAPNAAPRAAGTPAPALTVTDSGTLSAFAGILEWAQTPREFDAALAPAMLIEVTPAAGEPYRITLWIYEGRLYCGVAAGGEDMRLYVAGGSLDDLLALVMN